MPNTETQPDGPSRRTAQSFDALLKDISPERRTRIQAATERLITEYDKAQSDREEPPSLRTTRPR